MNFKCAFCDKPEAYPKWFVCPGHIYRPNQYSVCEDHKHLSLKYEDVYLNDNEPPVLRHDHKLKIQAGEKVMAKYSEALNNLKDK